MMMCWGHWIFNIWIKGKKIDLSTLQQRQKRGDSIEAYKIVSGKDKIDAGLLFTPQMLWLQTSGNQYKPHKKSCNLQLGEILHAKSCKRLEQSTGVLWTLHPWWTISRTDLESCWKKRDGTILKADAVGSIILKVQVSTKYQRGKTLATFSGFLNLTNVSNMPCSELLSQELGNWFWYV